MSLDAIVKALQRAGVEPTARELAESLWLAAQMTGAARAPRAAQEPPGRHRPSPRPTPVPAVE
ncbi:hypothetical protein, partial [Paractinoplanes deccanensis]|uniref:hypothetical protein n=1 Tax=Paractinoplanes deccanensis TaxID=113561 RepID=UPI003608D079